MSTEAEEAIRLECHIAAMLTISVIGQAGATPPHAVNQYCRVLQMLRQAGGPVNPVEIRR